MRKTTWSMAPRSEPAGCVADAALAMAAAPAAPDRLMAATTPAPPAASAAATKVRRSKRAAPVRPGDGSAVTPPR